jgi:two-component system, NtrC family, response regulator PilR
MRPQIMLAFWKNYLPLFGSSWVKELFLTTPEVKDPEKLRQTLGKLILVRVAILSILLGLSSWDLLVHSGASIATQPVFRSLGLIYGVSLVNALCLRYIKQPRFCGYGQLVIDVLLATLAIYVTNSTVSISLYLLAIVAAVLVFGRHGALITAAFSGLCYAVLASGLLPPIHGRLWSASTQDILGVYVSLVTIALVSGYIAKQLDQLGYIADRNAKNLDTLNKQQHQLFNDISEGIITLDLDTTITSINEAARAILGLARLDARHFVGHPLPAVLKDNGLTGADELLHGTDSQASPVETTIYDSRQEQDIHLSYSLKPLCDADGNTLGNILIFDDVSHVRNMQERLDLHERMTKLLAESSSKGNGTPLTFKDVQMVGESQLMKRVINLVEKVSVSDASVLITGESGTGKELIARAIHMNSPRRNKAFVAINCGAIPENLIESELFGHKKGSFTGAVSDNPGLLRQAQGGTVFLDEIGELPQHLQTKLLRVLQDKMVRSVGDTRDTILDVRVIAATNRDLKKEIAASRFREDLYYRLNVVNIMLPPLRDRKEDIPLLVHYFIARFCHKDQVVPHISPEALTLLTLYSYPGNVRELENIIERMLVLSGSAVLPEHLPDEVLACASLQNGARMASQSLMATGDETSIHILPIDLESELSKLEKKYLHDALNQAGGVKKHAAELLGLNFRSFRYRVKKYGLSDDSDDMSEG